ncbi:hypothetical protein K440DRAFT_638297 [Wilcoxina mikolae CBS 423.85]|nr:hypothetical protein K440DRAFT_638297 [Wilcoxina mikolae CBS 423.85]
MYVVSFATYSKWWLVLCHSYLIFLPLPCLYFTTTTENSKTPKLRQLRNDSSAATNSAFRYLQNSLRQEFTITGVVRPDWSLRNTAFALLIDTDIVWQALKDQGTHEQKVAAEVLKVQNTVNTEFEKLTTELHGMEKRLLSTKQELERRMNDKFEGLQGSFNETKGVVKSINQLLVVPVVAFVGKMLYDEYGSKQ